MEDALKYLRLQAGSTDQFELLKRKENISYELTFKPRRNFEFKLNNACMHNTINEFGFLELSFQAIAFN